jgi:hypothetical protein
MAQAKLELSQNQLLRHLLKFGELDPSPNW